MTRPTESPAILAANAPPRARATNYPAELAHQVAGRDKRPLGDLFGLKAFGVNLTRLAPGAQSAFFHRHTRQDEFLYVLEGEPTLITEEGEFSLRPGMCAGFAAGGSRPPPRQPIGEGGSLPGDGGSASGRRGGLSARLSPGRDGAGRELAFHPQGRVSVLSVRRGLQGGRGLGVPFHGEALGIHSISRAVSGPTPSSAALSGRRPFPGESGVRRP